MRRVRRVRRGDDSGQLTVLVIGFTAVLVLLVTVVVNASKAFLVQRSLSGAADGAAAAAANAVDESAVYDGTTGDTLPLDAGAARDAVVRYATEAGLAERFVGFDVAAVSTDGATATVTLTATVPMPLLTYLSADYAAGYPVQVTASARSPLLP